MSAPVSAMDSPLRCSSRAGAARDAQSESSSSPSWLAPLPFLLLPMAGADSGAVPIPAGQLASRRASAGSLSWQPPGNYFVADGSWHPEREDGEILSQTCHWMRGRTPLSSWTGYVSEVQ